MTVTGGEIQHGATTVVFACTWGSNGDQCPIPAESRETWEQYQQNEGAE